MDQLYFDGMSFCSHVGYPQIQRLLSPMNLKAQDHLDIVSRVFKIIFEELLFDLTKIHVMGKVMACMSPLDQYINQIHIVFPLFKSLIFIVLTNVFFLLTFRYVYD